MIESSKVNIKNKWYQVPEVGSTFGMKILLSIHQKIGSWAFYLCLHPVILFYWITNPAVRRSSKKYLSNWKAYYRKELPKNYFFSTYLHLYEFGVSILDKLLAWQGEINIDQLEFENQSELLNLATQNKGLVFISSHFGNIEICRALTKIFPQLKIEIFIHTENSKKFNSLLKKINPDSHLNLILVDNIGIETSILLKEKIEKGHWVFIMGDRIPVGEKKRVQQISFLGHRSSFPMGPFILAWMMECPIYSMCCYKNFKNFKVSTKMLTSSYRPARAQRDEWVKKLSVDYVKALEECVQDSPFQWFNFHWDWSS